MGLVVRSTWVSVAVRGELEGPGWMARTRVEFGVERGW
jgi:hypothetical protein